MKVYVLTYKHDQGESHYCDYCLGKNIREIEVYGTREAAEAAAKGRMSPTICEREVGV
jgi:hypothetical protein